MNVNASAGMAVMIILMAMAGSWLLRAFLLRTLRHRYPHEFAGLGHPSYRQLASLHPRYREMQLQFWKYLWSGKVFQVDDKLVSSLAVAALIADVILAIGVVMLLWSAGQ